VPDPPSSTDSSSAVVKPQKNKPILGKITKRDSTSKVKMKRESEPESSIDSSSYSKKTQQNELSEDSSDPILPGENPDSDFDESLNRDSLNRDPLENLEESILRESLDIVGSLDNEIEQLDSDDKERREEFKVGDQVECRDTDKSWIKGVVTKTQPLKINPKHWPISKEFDEVRPYSDD